MKNDDLIVNSDHLSESSGWGINTNWMLDEGKALVIGNCSEDVKPWVPMNGTVIVNVSCMLYAEKRPVRIKKGPGKGQIKMVTVKLTNPIEQITKLKEFKT